MTVGKDYFTAVHEKPANTFSRPAMPKGWKPNFPEHLLDEQATPSERIDNAKHEIELLKLDFQVSVNVAQPLTEQELSELCWHGATLKARNMTRDRQIQCTGVGLVTNQGS